MIGIHVFFNYPKVREKLVIPFRKFLHKTADDINGATASSLSKLFTNPVLGSSGFNEITTGISDELDKQVCLEEVKQTV